MIKVYGYKKCSTVSKSIKFLKNQDYEVEFFDFVQEQIPRDVLINLINNSTLDIDVFFNQKGQLFKSLGLKVLLEKINDDEKLNLLLSDGKLIKRPIIEINDKIFVGFNESDLQQYLDDNK